MPLMDEFKDEREKVKKQPFKKKLGYFWTYYKWFVICGIIAVIVIVTTVRSFINKKDYALYGVMLNGFLLSKEDTLASGFEEYAGIDQSQYTVSFNSTLSMSDNMDQNGVSASQFIMVYIAARYLDVAVLDPPRFAKYATSNTYMDLRELLDDKMLEQLSDKLYYVDNAVLQEIDALEDTTGSIEDVEIPDPSKPENMKDPIPIGINISECKKFTDAYAYNSDEVYLGVVVNTKNRDLCLKLIQYLFSE